VFFTREGTAFRFWNINIFAVYFTYRGGRISDDTVDSKAEDKGDSGMKTNRKFHFDDEPRDLHVCELKRDKNVNKLEQITGHPTVSCEFCGAEANSGEYVCSVVPWHKIRVVYGGNSHENPGN
jgi:hypothetical protein